MKTRFRGIFVALTILANLGYVAPAATITWTNTAGGNWSEPANWNPNQVPDAPDVAVITNDGNYTVEIDSSNPVGGLTLGAISGSSTQSLVGASVTVNGQIVVNAHGRFVLHNGLFGTNTLSGTLTEWTGNGYSAGTITIASNGVLKIDGDASGLGSGFRFDGFMTNFGTVNLIDALVLGDTFQIENHGLVNVQDTGGIDSGTAIFHNFGTFRRAADTNISTVTAMFNDTGLVEVQGGTLILRGGGVFSGTGTVSDGANLIFYDYGTTNTFYSPTFTGGGRVQWDGSIVCNGLITASNLESHGNPLRGANTLVGTMICDGSLEGPLTIASNSTFIATRDGNGNTMSFSSGLVLTNYGTAIWIESDVPVADTQIYNYGIWDAQSDNGMGSGGVHSSIFYNYGIFRKSAGTNTSIVDRSITFNNFGTVDVETGTLAIAGGGTNSGKFNASPGSVVAFSEEFGNGYAFNDGTAFTGDVSIRAEVFIDGHVSAQNLQFAGLVNFGLRGPTSFGQLNVSNTLTILNNPFFGLYANMAATLLGGFVPATNLSFQVMTYGALDGNFTDFSGLNVGSGVYFKPVVTDSDLTLATSQAPAANPDAITVIVNTVTNIPVLENDLDAYGLALSLASATQGGHGDVSINGTNVIYQPATNYQGSDSFTYVVSNGDGGSSTGLVTVTVVPLSSGGNSNTLVTLTTLHHFANADGATPYSPLLQASNGKLYGMTYTGGTSNVGTIFDLTLDGVFSNLFSFEGTNGASPFGALAQGSDGSLYGTTQNGGVHKNQFNTTIGTLFRFSLDGQFTNLVFFNVTNGMIGGGGILRGNNGELYGSTGAGGTNNTANDGGNPVPSGNIFRIGTNGGLTTLAYLNATNGAFPQAPLTDGGDGNLYSVASGGGVAFSGYIYSGYGTVFRVATNGGLSLVALFQGTNGSNPYNSGLLQSPDGSFYGMTRYGGMGFTNGQAASGYGTIYRITTNGTITTLFKFNGANGSQPLGTLIRSASGVLLGTTSFGGNGFNGANYSGYGTVFQITTNGVYTSLHLFNGADGQSPYEGLTAASDGNFYGTTAYGGPSNAGTIFRLSFSPVPPLLSINAVGANVTVSWPYPSSGWTLQQNSNLNTIQWTTSLGVSNDGTNNFKVISPATGSLFFRLISN